MAILTGFKFKRNDQSKENAMGKKNGKNNKKTETPAEKVPQAWLDYCASGKKPADIPDRPDIVYADEWKGWDDFLPQIEGFCSEVNMKRVKCQYLVIGAIERNGKWVACGSQEVQKQKQAYLRLTIHPDARFVPGDKAEGQPVTVDSFVGIIDYIAGDRKLRVDRGIAMADRPPLMVVAHSAEGANGGPGVIIQIDVYSGHDFLSNDRHMGDAENEADVPDFTDPADAGIRLPYLGIVHWNGNFQTDYNPLVGGSSMTEEDQEAFSGIAIGFKDHKAYRGFVTLGPERIYQASRRLIVGSTAWHSCRRVATELGMSLGSYSIATWSGNVGDVFRAITKGTISEPTTVEAWAKAIRDEFGANVKALGLF
jgi:hypothetical protein